MKKNKAQSTLEYAVLIACLVAALLSMQIYLKRAASGRLRQVADELGQQYSPRRTTGTYTMAVNSSTTTVVKTLSERDLFRLCMKEPGADKADCRKRCNLNKKDGIEDDVFTTETISWLDYEDTTQKGNETVGKLEASLF